MLNIPSTDDVMFKKAGWIIKKYPQKNITNQRIAPREMIYNHFKEFQSPDLIRFKDEIEWDSKKVDNNIRFTRWIIPVLITSAITVVIFMVSSSFKNTSINLYSIIIIAVIVLAYLIFMVLYLMIESIWLNRKTSIYNLTLGILTDILNNRGID